MTFIVILSMWLCYYDNMCDERFVDAKMMWAHM